MIATPKSIASHNLRNIEIELGAFLAPNDDYQIKYKGRYYDLITGQLSKGCGYLLHYSDMNLGENALVFIKANHNSHYKAVKKIIEIIEQDSFLVYD